MTKYPVQTSLLTISQTLFMGMIDAYTFSHFDGTFASAQTGNLIVFGISFVKDGIGRASVHIPVFLGFLFGAMFAQWLKYYINERRWASELNQLRIYTLISIVIAIIILVIQITLVSETMIFLTVLGFFASYELTLFNRIGNTSVNNGIMTGNIKNFGNLLSDFIRHPSWKIGYAMSSFGANIFVFMLGVIAGTYYFKQLALVILTSGIGLNAVLFIGLMLTRSDQAESKLANER